jgi:hypothetical protein
LPATACNGTDGVNDGTRICNGTTDGNGEPVNVADVGGVAGVVVAVVGATAGLAVLPLNDNDGGDDVATTGADGGV